MLRNGASHLLAGAAVALLAGVGSPSLAQEKLIGVPALAGAAARASGALSVREIGPLERELEITMSDVATGKPLLDYEEELTQELHVIAVDSTLSTFVHEHAEEVDADGRFRVNVQFPKPGTYHVYADAAPVGLGQQVLRFEVPVGQPSAAAPASLEPQSGGVLASSVGSYSVELDASDLQSGKEAEMTMRILREDRPAGDLAPYLGVPAHAVFVAADDLAYVHAHATAAEAEQPHGSGAHGGRGAPNTAVSVPPELTLHVTPPRAGAYALWIQFIGGGDVRTVPFVISVPEADEG